MGRTHASIVGREPTTDELIAAGHVREHRSPFGLPQGWKGRLAGWYMGFSDAQHRELVALVPVDEARTLVEIGFGPGQVLHALHRRAPHLELAGVDPSELMVRRARRRNRTADLRVGAAAAMPFPDGYADVVVAVNNVPMWPDLDAGVREVRRVMAAAGSALIAWHGGHDPRGHQQQLVLSDARLDAITTACHAVFGDVQLATLQHSVLWTLRT